MFGMEDIVKEASSKKEEKIDRSMAKVAMKNMIEKEAKDHYHMDSEDQKTSPSIHEEGKEEKPHKHKLKDGGETDKKESGKQHIHKEKDEDGGKTGPAIKTASKAKMIAGGLGLTGLGAAGGYAYGNKKGKDKGRREGYSEGAKDMQELINMEVREATKNKQGKNFIKNMADNAEKTASSREEHAFIEGFEKAAFLGDWWDNQKKKKVKVKKDGKMVEMSNEELARKAYKAAHGKDYK